ncbi:Haloalkane dehalogenase [Acaryochloris thomasi RCC1774]|uniref:Haloalkane dehalogenase n=1 Tax=Acaryochloris thomasi RCC1774 TaxID=1764569 RepID=A0A2W1JPB3_9CYAN|nr:haloalkane dehalogenase [Acaryochloris thomasi]PZD75153.1 Haloalkane dehalogenase [Acaryochloris thomasi RCC1774]
MIKKVSIWPIAISVLTLTAVQEAGFSAPDPLSPATQTEQVSMKQIISAEFPFEKKFVEVNGSKMAYVDEGEGPVVLFLHGNPTSSYLWRNIIPYVSDNHRAIAIDLIGMGDSDKPDIDYTFSDHTAYLDGFIKALNLTDITLVVHDWGSALGMRYARLNEDNVSGLVFMEAVIPPAFPAPNYEALGPQLGEIFRNLRTPGVGEQLVLDNNFFVETILPKLGVMRTLTPQEMAAYRAPYLTRASRKPTLQWPREIPIGGEPSATTAEVAANGKWLMSTDLPKLFFYAEPGAILPVQAVEFLKTNVKNMETVSIGPGLHFIQEDNPQVIGEEIFAWLDRSQRAK